MAKRLSNTKTSRKPSKEIKFATSTGPTNWKVSFNKIKKYVPFGHYVPIMIIGMLATFGASFIFQTMSGHAPIINNYGSTDNASKDTASKNNASLSTNISTNIKIKTERTDQASYSSVNAATPTGHDDLLHSCDNKKLSHSDCITHTHTDALEELDNSIVQYIEERQDTIPVLTQFNSRIEMQAAGQWETVSLAVMGSDGKLAIREHTIQPNNPIQLPNLNNSAFNSSHSNNSVFNQSNFNNN